MKKTGVAVALVALVAGGWLAASAYTSHRFEGAYREQMAAMQKKYPFVQVGELQVKSGLMSGVYSGKITVGCSGKTGHGLVINWEDQVQYGPFPGFASFGAATIKSHFSVGDDAPAALRKALAALMPADISTQIGYGGSFATRLRLPAGEFQVNEEAMQSQARWAEALIEASGQMDGSHVSYHWQMPEFAVSIKPAASVPAMDLKIKGAELRGDSQSAGAYVWLRQGADSGSIEHMESTTTGPDGQAMGSVIDKLAFKGDSSLTQDMLGSHVQYTIGTMTFPMPGKTIAVTNTQVQASFKHLHAPTVDKLVAQLMDAVYGQCDASADTSPDPTAAAVARATAMLQAFARAGEGAKQLLAYDPELSIDKFAMEIDGKRGEFSFAAGVNGLKAPDLTGPAGALQMKLMQALKVNAQGKMPLAWLNLAGGETNAEQVQLMSDSMVQRGFAVREGDFLTAQFQFDKGAMKLNGKPMGGPAGAAAPAAEPASATQ